MFVFTGNCQRYRTGHNLLQKQSKASLMNCIARAHSKNWDKNKRTKRGWNNNNGSQVGCISNVTWQNMKTTDGGSGSDGGSYTTAFGLFAGSFRLWWERHKERERDKESTGKGGYKKCEKYGRENTFGKWRGIILNEANVWENIVVAAVPILLVTVLNWDEGWIDGFAKRRC